MKSDPIIISIFSFYQCPLPGSVGVCHIAAGVCSVILCFIGIIPAVVLSVVSRGDGNSSSVAALIENGRWGDWSSTAKIWDNSSLTNYFLSAFVKISSIRTVGLASSKEEESLLRGRFSLHFLSFSLFRLKVALLATAACWLRRRFLWLSLISLSLSIICWRSSGVIPARYLSIISAISRRTWEFSTFWNIEVSDCLFWRRILRGVGEAETTAIT